MLQVLGGEFRSGAEAVAKLIGLAEAVAEADWVITGEGRSDAQTLLGKAPFCVASLASVSKCRVTLTSGGIDLAALPALNEVFSGGCFSLCHRPMSLAEAMAEAPQQLAALAEQLACLFESR
jgi:glycerate kinase